MASQPHEETLVDRIQETIDRTTTSVEGIHKSIAEVPLDVMRELGAFEQTADAVGDLQDRSIGAIYDLVRAVNREVTGLASDLLRSEATPPRVDAE